MDVDALMDSNNRGSVDTETFDGGMFLTNKIRSTSHIFGPFLETKNLSTRRTQHIPSIVYHDA